jgi:hypothetical protein
MKKILLLLIISSLLQSCGVFMVKSGTEFDRKKMKKVEFCELENFNGKLIKTDLEYSGFEEYWSGNGFSKCERNNNVDIDFSEYYEGWKWIFINRQLQRLNRNYSNRKAKMKIIGIFEIDTINGFGHLNTYKARILVKSVKINIKSK